MPRVQPHYAVKANPHPAVLRTLIEEGVGFEIASIAELDLLLEPRRAGRRDLLQQPGEVAAATSSTRRRRGVRWYVLDSVEELRKIVSIKPDASLYLRIDAPNVGSDWPLSGKFGAQPQEAEEIIALAARAEGGSGGRDLPRRLAVPQRGQLARRASRAPSACMRKMRLKGLKPRLLNIGGGYPVRHTKPIPSIEVIGEVVNRALAGLPDGRPGDGRAGPLPGLRCRLVRLPGGGNGHAQRQALGVFRRRACSAASSRPPRGCSTTCVTDRTGRLDPVDRRRARPATRWTSSCAISCCPRTCGRRLRLHPQRGRLHHGLRQQLQRLSAAGGADADASALQAAAVRSPSTTAGRALGAPDFVVLRFRAACCCRLTR